MCVPRPALLQTNLNSLGEGRVSLWHNAAHDLLPACLDTLLRRHHWRAARTLADSSILHLDVFSWRAMLKANIYCKRVERLIDEKELGWLYRRVGRHEGEPSA